MTTLLLVLMIWSGIVMSIAILLMAPKWGLGFGLGGMGWSNEYGTKKSIEWSLKKVATIGAILFVISSLFYPFTKPVTNTNANANSGSTAPSFDLGNKNSTGVANEVVIGSGSTTGN